jgi:Raf kinase inhibitor-like YbhB/YbcL family protein
MLDSDPYAALAALKPVPSFHLTSTDVSVGSPLAPAQYASAVGGQDRSPQLSWSGFPQETKSFAVTCFDPDAPSASGWWHWVVCNIPATVTSLPAGAGSPGGAGLPDGALTLRNDGGEPAYAGAAPPAGTGTHRYIFAVHALDVPTLPLDRDATPADAGLKVHFHLLGRALLTTQGEPGRVR